MFAVYIIITLNFQTFKMSFHLDDLASACSENTDHYLSYMYVRIFLREHGGFEVKRANFFVAQKSG